MSWDCFNSNYLVWSVLSWYLTPFRRNVLSTAWNGQPQIHSHHLTIQYFAHDVGFHSTMAVHFDPEYLTTLSLTAASDLYSFWGSNPAALNMPESYPSCFTWWRVQSYLVGEWSSMILQHHPLRNTSICSSPRANFVAVHLHLMLQV